MEEIRIRYLIVTLKEALALFVLRHKEMTNLLVSLSLRFYALRMCRRMQGGHCAREV